jgi:acyl-CoA thioesterase FadM
MSAGESIGSTLDSFHRLTEIACFEHAKELGIGDDVVRPKGWMWLIAKTSVEFFHPWTQDGDIVVQTLPVFGSATGLLWMIEIQTASGPLARQTYHWVLADQASGRPLRMPETLRGDRAVFKQIEDAEYGVFDKPAKLVQSIKKRWIPASDVDENGHVHNTCHVRYAFEDATRWPMRYAVWYHAPLMAESELSIRAKQGTGLLVLEGFFVLTAATPTFTVRVRIIQ